MLLSPEHLSHCPVDCAAWFPVVAPILSLLASRAAVSHQRLCVCFISRGSTSSTLASGGVHIHLGCIVLATPNLRSRLKISEEKKNLEEKGGTFSWGLLHLV